MKHDRSQLDDSAALRLSLKNKEHVLSYVLEFMPEPSRWMMAAFGLAVLVPLVRKTVARTGGTV